MTKPIKQPTGMPDMSLVEKAKGVQLHPRFKASEADVALALAWVRGDVTITQCFRAWNLSSGTAAYVKLAQALRRYIIETDL